MAVRVSPELVTRPMAGPIAQPAQAPSAFSQTNRDRDRGAEDW